MPQAPQIAVLGPHRHPRLRYTLQVIGQDLGYHFRLFTDQAKWSGYDCAYRLVYGTRSLDESIPHLPAHHFLAGASPSPDDLRVEVVDGFPLFFRTEQSFDHIDNDLLACIFYGLSRYEEYGAGDYDEHQRFIGKRSHAHKNNYLHLPVVRRWTRWVAAVLRDYYPELPEPKEHTFYVQPSYDIDLLWAYEYRGIRGFASGVKDLLTGNARRAFARWKSKPENDPYATLPYLLALHERLRRNSNSQVQVFWLLANNDDHRDPNPFPIPEEQVQLIRSLSDRVAHGIHPSYLSSEKSELITLELKRLRSFSEQYIDASRQHFLRFQLPVTYRALLRAGIRKDFSMGYADVVGWRAGTNLPFPWYDLEKEEATGLIIHPFAAMDVTLKKYLKLAPQWARLEVYDLAVATKQFGGPFPLLWHNSSFAEDYGWKGWKEMYEELMEELYAM